MPLPVKWRKAPILSAGLPQHQNYQAVEQGTEGILKSLGTSSRTPFPTKTDAEVERGGRRVPVVVCLA